MKQPTLVFFDLETTSTDVAKAQIIQIGAVAVNEQLNIFNTLEVKLRFDVEDADPEALLVNGYSEEVWDTDAVSEVDALWEFAGFCRKYSEVQMVSKAGKPYGVAQLVGHNAASYDAQILFTLYKRSNIFLPASYKVLDTLQRAIWYFHEHPDVAQPENHQLGTLAAYFCVEVGKAHDALDDCKATVGIYRELLKRTSTRVAE